MDQISKINNNPKISKDRCLKQSILCIHPFASSEFHPFELSIAQKPCSLSFSSLLLSLLAVFRDHPFCNLFDLLPSSIAAKQPFKAKTKTSNK